MRAIQVVIDNEDRNGYKIMIDYVKRGSTLHSRDLANQEADKIAKIENIKTVFHA